jgi:hypothetical protein
MIGAAGSSVVVVPHPVELLLVAPISRSRPYHFRHSDEDTFSAIVFFSYIIQKPLQPSFSRRSLYIPVSTA